jgi:hypothetical protein
MEKVPTIDELVAALKKIPNVKVDGTNESPRIILPSIERVAKSIKEILLRNKWNVSAFAIQSPDGWLIPRLEDEQRNFAIDQYTLDNTFVSTKRFDPSGMPIQEAVAIDYSEQVGVHQ